MADWTDFAVDGLQAAERPFDPREISIGLNRLLGIKLLGRHRRANSAPVRYERSGKATPWRNGNHECALNMRLGSGCRHAAVKGSRLQLHSNAHRNEVA